MNKPKFFAICTNAESGRIDFVALSSRTADAAHIETLGLIEDDDVLDIVNRKSLERIHAQIEVLLS
jgi:hypothetical protein